MWPPNYPDLNPVDYGIWESLAHRVYQDSISDIKDLKAALRRHWIQLPQDMIIRALDQHRPRLRKVIETNGKHIKHLL